MIRPREIPDKRFMERLRMGEVMEPSKERALLQKLHIEYLKKKNKFDDKDLQFEREFGKKRVVKRAKRKDKSAKEMMR